MGFIPLRLKGLFNAIESSDKKIYLLAYMLQRRPSQVRTDWYIKEDEDVIP